MLGGMGIEGAGPHLQMDRKQGCQEPGGPRRLFALCLVCLLWLRRYLHASIRTTYYRQGIVYSSSNSAHAQFPFLVTAGVTVTRKRRPGPNCSG